MAILDLRESAGQPLACLRSRYWVSYNGEIYNFLELRKELELCGYPFHTDTDTEVIAAAYDRWGEECQLRFNGMWAFALWDSDRQTLFLSRDRFGIKPLFYATFANTFAFASELKAFLSLEGFYARENEEVLRRMLVDSCGLEATEQTLLVGVHRLGAGHSMHVRRTGVTVSRWWNTLDHLPRQQRTLAQQAERFQELFLDSCRLRLRSDVPLATCLSGGLDSSSVLCSLAALRDRAGGSLDAERRPSDFQRAFVATFPGTPWDEREYAEIALGHAKALPRIRPISPEIATAVLYRFAFDFEEFDRELHVPLWLLYRELRRDGIMVSLDGHGSDEMLAGYLHDLDAVLKCAGSLFRAPFTTVSWVRALHGMTGASGGSSLLGLLIASDPTLRRIHGFARSLGSRGRAALPGRAVPRLEEHRPWVNAPADSLLPTPSSEEAALATLGALTSRLYRAFHRTMLPKILRNFDRCSMAHGIEVRMPFMDWRLVCFAFSLPDSSKVGGGFSKRVLREAMKGILPETLRTRRSKIGFASPLPNWFSGSLREWVWEVCNDTDFVNSPTWDGAAIRRFVAERNQAACWSRRDCMRVWPFLHAHLWRKAFLEKKGKRDGKTETEVLV